MRIYFIQVAKKAKQSTSKAENDCETVMEVHHHLDCGNKQDRKYNEGVNRNRTNFDVIGKKG